MFDAAAVCADVCFATPVARERRVTPLPDEVFFLP